MVSTLFLADNIDIFYMGLPLRSRIFLEAPRIFPANDVSMIKDIQGYIFSPKKSYSSLPRTQRQPNISSWAAQIQILGNIKNQIYVVTARGICLYQLAGVYITSGCYFFPPPIISNADFSFPFFCFIRSVLAPGTKRRYDKSASGGGGGGVFL